MSIRYYEIVYMGKKWISNYYEDKHLNINEAFRTMSQDWDKYVGKKQYAFGVVEYNTDLTKLPSPTELI